MSKYNASGTTHNNGIGATFALRFAETVTSNPDAHADSNTHKTIRDTVGAGASVRSTASLTSAASERGCLLFK